MTRSRRCADTPSAALAARAGSWARRSAQAALVGLLLAGTAPSCNDGSGLLRAKQIETRAERIGGPVSMADVGDFLLENDQIRVGILGAIDSPGPGPYGGSVVDIDRRRPRLGTQGPNGIDRFAEAFPLANLLVPEPDGTQVSVLKDGSDGQEAAIRVEGEGGFFLEALGVLRSYQAGLEQYFPGIVTRLHFTTDYILRPGERFLRIRTELRLGDEVPEACPSLAGCTAECAYGHSTDPVTGCLTCACSDLVPLDQYSGSSPVFRDLLGDAVNEEGAEQRGGIVAGDFVFFGNQSDLFAPGPGFDETWAVYAAFNLGQNTFQDPLSYDFVAAAGGDVSYAYFTVSREGEAPTRVNVPLITSAATAFLSAHKNCLFAASDDSTCDRHRSFVYERYLGVGDGDIASALEPMYELRHTSVGRLSGAIFWQQTGKPAANSQVLLFEDPEPGREWTSVDEVTTANLAARGDFGLLTAIDADLGLDEVEDGDFSALVPAGYYVAVAQAPDGSSISRPISVEVRRKEESQVVAMLPMPAKLAFRVTDETGTLMPAKVTVTSLDGASRPLTGDGLRRPFMGHTRLGNGRQSQVLSNSGFGEMRIPPGHYVVTVSRGPEYGIVQREITVGAGGLAAVDAMLRHEVDTRGWIGIDTHLHSTMSFDSGLSIDERVRACAVEGLDVAISTDHDVTTDYRPAIRELMLEPEITTAPGNEISTLEQGHFIGFPLRYDAMAGPSHGGLDWTCHNVGQVMDWIANEGSDGPTLRIAAHPRDGFLGFLSQLGVDPFTMNRTLPMLESGNPVFRTATCDFDAMEVFNAKRFELIRTPSVAEVVDWNRCLERVNAATSISELDGICPEYLPGMAAACSETERFVECQDRNRTVLAFAGIRRVLARTPEEQAANWAFTGSGEDSEALCSWDVIEGEPIGPEMADQPCAFRPGHLDDLFRMLEHGLSPTVVGGSDSHGPNLEPGFSRSYVPSGTDSPAAIQISDVVAAMKEGRSFPSYGPFIRATIDDLTYGDVVRAQPGQALELKLDVQTASWFGVDRVEVYLNGLIVQVAEPNEPSSAIVDLRGKVSFTVPDRDSWLIVTAMGLHDDHLMRAVNLDVPYGELELSRIASDAFSRVPMAASLFSPPPSSPNWGPVVPYAATNPIYVDVDGNGRYDAPLPAPDFCSRPCDPASADPNQCPEGQQCLDKEALCGFNIEGDCVRRAADAFRDY